jgi:hypothetical protein
MKRLTPALALLALVFSLFAFPSAPAALAQDGCSGESSVTTRPGGATVRVVQNGQPVPNAPVVIRDAATGSTIGRDRTNASGLLSGTLRDDLAASGLTLDIVITLPNGDREICSATIPPVDGGAVRPADPPPDRGEPQPLEVVFETLYASGWGPGYRNIYDAVNIPVVYRELPEYIFGAYNGRRIALNYVYASNPEGLSVVLAHELTHAMQDYEGRLTRPPSADPENCFEAEFEATHNDARVWLSYYPNLRSPTRDPLDRDLNRTARRLLSEGPEGIRQMIRDNSEDQCGGGHFERVDDSFVGEPPIDFSHTIADWDLSDSLAGIAP